MRRQCLHPVGRQRLHPADLQSSYIISYGNEIWPESSFLTFGCKLWESSYALSSSTFLFSHDTSDVLGCSCPIRLGPELVRGNPHWTHWMSHTRTSVVISHWDIMPVCCHIISEPILTNCCCCCCSIAKYCDLMDCSTPGFPVLHHLPELAKIHVHSQWCYPNIPSSVIPFSFCAQFFPASGSFSMSQLFASGDKSIGASASVLPMNIQGWFLLHTSFNYSFYQSPLYLISVAIILHSNQLQNSVACNKKLSFLLHGAEGLLKLSVLSQGIYDPHFHISIINGGIWKG